ERRGLRGDAADLHYDAKVVEAVKKYQRTNELKVTGALDAQTIRELNGPPRDKQIDIIIANMERWRWIPRDLGKTHVIVNLPDFTLRLMHNGSMLWTTRIVIGKPAMPTPLLTETMKYITVNPIWNVPQSIVQNDICRRSRRTLPCSPGWVSTSLGNVAAACVSISRPATAILSAGYVSIFP